MGLAFLITTENLQLLSERKVLKENEYAALLDASVGIIALRDAMRAHDEEIVHEIADALGCYLPRADKGQRTATAHTILLISHDLLMAASRREDEHADLLLKNLRVCVYALVNRLQLG